MPFVTSGSLTVETSQSPVQIQFSLGQNGQFCMVAAPFRLADSGS
jgi:hypothetical protein